MKKKIVSLIMVVFTAVMMIGCNKTGLSLFEELQKIYEWNGNESKADLVVEVEADGQMIKFYGDVTGYSSIKDEITEAVMTFKKLETAGETVDLTTGESKIDPIKVIMKGEDVYISKSYFENIFGLVGLDTTNALQNMKSEYVGLKYDSVDISQKGINAYMDIMKKVNTEFEIVQNDRTYTIALSDDELLALTSDFMNVLFESDIIKESVLATEEVTESEYAEILPEIKTIMDEMFAEIKPMLAGSNAKVEYTFADDSCKSNCELNLVMNAEGEKASIKIAMTQECKKVDKKEVQIPANTPVYTMDEFTEMLIPNVAYIAEDDVVVKGNISYVPLKYIMDQLEIPVKYDSKTKTTSVVIDGKETKVTTKLISGTSYVTPATLQKLGFDCYEEEGYIVITPLF